MIYLVHLNEYYVGHDLQICLWFDFEVFFSPSHLKVKCGLTLLFIIWTTLIYVLKLYNATLIKLIVYLLQFWGFGCVTTVTEAGQMVSNNRLYFDPLPHIHQPYHWTIQFDCYAQEKCSQSSGPSTFHQACRWSGLFAAWAAQTYWDDFQREWE